jgi:hypothetical protein
MITITYAPHASLVGGRIQKLSFVCPNMARELAECYLPPDRFFWTSTQIKNHGINVAILLRVIEFKDLGKE